MLRVSFLSDGCCSLAIILSIYIVHYTTVFTEHHMHYFTNGTDSEAASSDNEMSSIPLDYLTFPGSCQSEGMRGQKRGK